MTDMLLYLMKANIALLLFCGGYYLVLQHLTFYTLNRIYLVVAVVFSAIYPLINLNSYMQQHPQLAKPVQYMVVVDWQAVNSQTHALRHAPVDYRQWLLYIFWVGVTVMSIRLFVQCVSLYRLHRKSTAKHIGAQNVRIISQDINPFSFGNNIYVNPENHDEQSLRNIIKHEQVHVSQLHTADIILSEIGTVFYWFNPGIWLIRKAIRENLEFITDRKVLQQGVDSKTYQYNLLDVTFSTSAHTMVNHFNISTLKKRIMMMNSKRSSRVNLVRYAILPAILLLTMAFTLNKTGVAKRLVNQPVIKTQLAGLITIDHTIKNQVANLISAMKTNAAAGKLPMNADTGKTKRVEVKLAGKNALDSSTVILNGVIVSSFPKIDPDSIETVYVLKTSTAKKIAPNAKSVVLITTKHSEAGIKYREKLKDQGILQRAAIKGRVVTIDTLRMASIFSENDSLRPIKGRITGNVVVTNKAGNPVVVTPVNKLAAVSVYGRYQPRIVVGKDTANNPLFVIDGKVSKDISSVEPNDIESIVILKDSAATALYGAKAAKGVIVVKTKGKKDK